MVRNRNNNNARDMYNIFIKKASKKSGKKRRTLANLRTNDILLGAPETREREIEIRHERDNIWIVRCVFWLALVFV